MTIRFLILLKLSSIAFLELINLMTSAKLPLHFYHCFCLAVEVGRDSFFKHFFEFFVTIFFLLEYLIKI